MQVKGKDRQLLWYDILNFTNHVFDDNEHRNPDFCKAAKKLMHPTYLSVDPRAEDEGNETSEDSNTTLTCSQQHLFWSEICSDEVQEKSWSGCSMS